MSNDNKDPQGSGPPEPPLYDAILPEPEAVPLDPGHGAQHAPGVSGAVEQEIQILITVKGNQLGVQGPLHDTIFMYGVLERAKDVIRTMRDQAAKRPPGVTPGGLVIPKQGFIPPHRT